MQRGLELDIWADPSERKMISLILKSEGKVNNKESLYRRKNGEIFPALCSAALMSINDEQLVLITARTSITLKKIESALRESERKFHSLFENSLDGMIVAKRDGKIIAANPAICEMLGMTEKEILEFGRQGIVVNDEKNIAALKAHNDFGKIVAQIDFRRKRIILFLKLKFQAETLSTSMDRRAFSSQFELLGTEVPQHKKKKKSGT